MRQFALAFVAAAAISVAAPARATTTDYTFSGPLAGSGSFSVFVDTSSVTDPSNPPTITLTAFSYTLGSTTFTLANTDFASLNPTQIAIGGSLDGVLGLPSGLDPGDDFIFDFNACAFDGLPGSFHCVADTSTQIQDITLRFGATQTVTSDRITIAPVGAPGAGGTLPEPATWAMMLLGFGGVGAALRRRRRFTKFAIGDC